MASVEFDQAWEHAVEKGFREGRQRRRNERFDQARERNKRLQRVVADLPSDAGMNRRQGVEERDRRAIERIRSEPTSRRKPVRRKTVSSPPRQEETQMSFDDALSTLGLPARGTPDNPYRSNDPYGFNAPKPAELGEAPTPATVEQQGGMGDYSAERFGDDRKGKAPAGYNQKKNIARQFAQIAGDESRSQFERDHAQGRVDEFFQETRRPEPQPNFDSLSGPAPTSAPPQPEMPVPNTGQGLVAPQGVADPIDVATENIEQQIDMSDGVNDPTNDEMGSAKTPPSPPQRVDATDFTAMPDYETDEEPSSFMALPEPEEEPLSDEAGEAGWKAIEESIRPPEPEPKSEPKPKPKPASKVPAVQEAVAPMKEEPKPKAESKADDSGFYDSSEGENPKARRVKFGDKFVDGAKANAMIRAGTHTWGPRGKDGRASIKEKAPPKKKAAPKKAEPKKATPKKAAPKKEEEKSPTDDLPKSKKSPKEAKKIAANIGDDKKPNKQTSTRNMPIGEPPAETEEEQFEKEPPAHKEEREKLEGNKKSGNPAQGAVAAALKGKAKPPKKGKKAEKKPDEEKPKTPVKAPAKDSPLGHNLAKKGYPLNKALSMKDLLAMGLVNDSGLFLTNREGRPAAGTAIGGDHVNMMTVAPQSVETGDLRGMIGIPMNLSPLITMSKNSQGPSKFPMYGRGNTRRYVGQGKDPFPPLTTTIGDDVFTGTGFSGDEFSIKDLQASAKKQGLGRYRKGAKRVVSPKLPSLLDEMEVPKLRSFNAPRFIREGTNSETLNPQEALLAPIGDRMMPVARGGQGEAVWELPFMDGKGKFMVNANIFDSFGATGQPVLVADKMGKPTGTRHHIPVMMPPDNLTDLGGPSVETSIKELMERLKNAPKDKTDIAFEEAPDSMYGSEYLKVIPKLKDFKDAPAILDLMQTPEGRPAPLQLRAETTEHGEPEGDFEGLMNELRYLLAPRIHANDEDVNPFVI